MTYAGVQLTLSEFIHYNPENIVLHIPYGGVLFVLVQYEAHASKWYTVRTVKL